jgi:hypothetical protein
MGREIFVFSYSEQYLVPDLSKTAGFANSVTSDVITTEHSTKTNMFTEYREGTN